MVLEGAAGFPKWNFRRQSTLDRCDERNETIEKREECLREAAEAMAEYQARERGLSEQMARQKALRLAQADRHPLEPAKQPRKIVVRRRAAA